MMGPGQGERPETAEGPWPAEGTSERRSSRSGATLAVGAVIVDRSGRVLLIRRGRPPLAGTWTLPGGRVERGETQEQAVLREVLEETALRTRWVAPLGCVTLSAEGYAFDIHEHLLVPVDPGAPLRAGDDAAEVRWTTPDELGALGVGAPAVHVVALGLAAARARDLVGDTTR